MSTGRTLILSISIIGFVTLQPASALAQNRMQFNPNSTLNLGGGTFGGVNLNSVGGAIASCSNMNGDTLSKWTDKATNSITGLFKSKPKSVVNPNAQTIQPMNSSGVNLPNLDQKTVDAHIQSVTQSGGSVQSQAAQGAGATAASGQSVPVTDDSAKKELERMNKREECLNGIAYAVGRNMLQQVVNKTLSLVNTGNFGNPYYVQDITSYLGSIADEQTQQFLDRIPNENPVFGNAIRSIVSEKITGVQDGLLSKTMDTPQGRAYQAFQEDFTNGGWEAFLDPHNNPINAIFNAADDLSQNITAQQQDVKDQLQRNGGFLDMKQCVQYKDSTTTSSGVTVPNLSQGAIDNHINSVTGGGTTTTGSGVTVPNLSQNAIDSHLNSITTKGSGAGAKASQPECLTWKTVTPGSVIAAQVNEVTTSPIRQLEQVDKMSDIINEVLGSFFNKMLDNLYSLGLGSLKGNNYGASFTLGTKGVNMVNGSNGQPIANSNQNPFGYTPSDSGSVSVEFDVSRPQQVRSILQAQYEYLNRAQDSQMAEERIIPVLGALDYCIPGPNPTWKDGLDENIKTYFNGLQVEGVTQSNTGSTIGGTAGAIAGSFIPIPGVGTAIGSAIGSFIGGLFDDNKPHALIGSNISLYDKITDSYLNISDGTWREKGHSPQLVYSNMVTRFNQVLDFYKKYYTLDAIKSAFVAADSGNATYAQGFTDSAFDETAKLGAYDQALSTIDNNYTTSIADTKEAIVELEAIRTEVNSIVATAKKRYVDEQKAAGTPVDQKCLDDAYQIDTSPVTAKNARVESDTPSPYLNQSVQAAVYFYSHL